MAEKTNGGAVAAKPAEEPLSKKEGVRRALKIAGNDAGPTQLQEVLKKEFNIVMTTDHISNYKSDILRKEGGGASKPKAKSKVKVKKTMAKKTTTKSKLVKPAPKPTAVKAPAASAAHATAAAKTSGVSIDDIKAVQGLAGRLGASHLKNLIDVLGK